MDFRNERKGLFLIFLALLVPSCSACLCSCSITNIIYVLLFEFIVLDFYVILTFFYETMVFFFVVVGFCFTFARLRFLLD